MTPVVGSWWTTCCIEDLDEIRSSTELAEVREMLFDEDGLVPRVWATKEAALAALLPEVTNGHISQGTKARLGL